MDFIKGLPRSANASCILVVVDKFTKFAHFVPLAHPYIASAVASIFMNEIYKLHGLPNSIISDRDPVFTRAFWRKLFQLAGTALKMSSSYHPQIDGQIEHVNQCLETFLHCLVHSCPKRWKAWLPATQFWYNLSFHSIVGHSSFEALYGRKLRVLSTQPPAAAAGKLDEWMAKRSIMNQLIHQHLS
jgi:hypothetical protein